ncbi:YciI family protein [Microbulbifer taiwanensis]|uniref:YciI family protein n=1 Tax=Microbulbifer taiwanensis TaxID=986746 RepID=A0ABW1YMX9_9GAMM|nr:YciI family protein [Microbulbifer taiwanensis]
MFVVILRFSENRERMGELMDAHKAWAKQGLDDGVFLMIGSLQPGLGGAILAHNISRQDLESFVDRDPFVAERIVTVEILEITPSKTDERLAFLSAV